MPGYSGIPTPYRFELAWHDYLDLANPAAGANAAVAVEGAWGLRVVAAIATLTTDGNAANRLLSLDYLGGRGSTYVRNAAGKVEAATNGGRTYVWSRNRAISEAVANTPVFVPLLDWLLDPGMSVQFTVDNKQAGDQLSALHLVVVKVPTGATPADQSELSEQ